MSDKDLLVLIPLSTSLEPAFAAGDPRFTVDPDGAAPRFVHDGDRKGAHFGRDTCVNVPVAGNFRR